MNTKGQKWEPNQPGSKSRNLNHFSCIACSHTFFQLLVGKKEDEAVYGSTLNTIKLSAVREEYCVGCNFQWVIEHLVDWPLLQVQEASQVSVIKLPWSTGILKYLLVFLLGWASECGLNLAVPCRPQRGEVSCHCPGVLIQITTGKRYIQNGIFFYTRLNGIKMIIYKIVYFLYLFEISFPPLKGSPLK